MKQRSKFFRTRVAARVFSLFLISAIVPIAGFSVLTFGMMQSHLKEQCLERLHQENKDMSVSIYERLYLFRGEMRMLASSLSSYPGNSMQEMAGILTKELRERLAGLTLVTDTGSTTLFPLDHHKNPPNLSTAERQHLKSGKAVLHQQLVPGSLPRLFVGVLLDPDHPKRGLLLGEISIAYLWEVADRKPPTAELFVLDGQNHILFSSLSRPASFSAESLRNMNITHSGQFEWIHNSTRYFMDFTTLFLEPNFFFPSWIVASGESYDEVLSPMIGFRRYFFPIIVISLGMVFLLSIGLIRKNMEPIEALQEATKKIADGSFGHKVEIESGDEFESLGKSFNEMSKKLKEGQALLVQAAKLSGIGQMAAGIIHELKQPLTAIYGHLQLAELEQISDKSRQHLETAQRAVDRLNSILLRFSAFSRLQEETIQDLPITKVIYDVYQLMDYQLKKKKIQCHIQAEKDLPQIRGNSQGLEQVFSNLLVNAIDALEDKGNGQRSVSIKAYSSANKVLVEVEDNGCGIPEDIQERIFDPFFTTKGTDKGTGLGMAIVASILHQHRARIDLESKVGVGTKFTLVFPVHLRQTILGSP